MGKFEVKRFVALIAFHEKTRNAFFNKVEVQGIDSQWDVYHVLADEESVPLKEIEIMEQVYKDMIFGNAEIELLYNSAIEDFRKNIRKKINRNS